jgi:hypothetical protein
MEAVPLLYWIRTSGFATTNAAVRFGVDGYEEK